MLSRRLAVQALRRLRVTIPTPTILSHARRHVNAKESHEPLPSSRATIDEFSGDKEGPGGVTFTGLLFLCILGGLTYTQIDHLDHMQLKSAMRHLDTFEEEAGGPLTALSAVQEQAGYWTYFIPCGRYTIQQFFDDFKSMRSIRHEEVDGIVRTTYHRLWKASRKGTKEEKIAETWSTLADLFRELGRIPQDVCNNESLQAARDFHTSDPLIEEEVNFCTNQVRQRGYAIGPEANKQVGETVDEMRRLAYQGQDGLERIRELTRRRMQSLSQLREEEWARGIEALRPMIDKNSKVWFIVTYSSDTMKYADVPGSLRMIEEALRSSNVEPLQRAIHAHEMYHATGLLGVIDRRVKCPFCTRLLLGHCSARNIGLWMELRPFCRKTPIDAQLKSLHNDAHSHQTASLRRKDISMGAKLADERGHECVVLTAAPRGML